MKKIKKLLVMFLAAVMIVGILPVQAEAASKVKINKTKTTIYVGSSTTLKVTGIKSKVSWSTSKKSVATVNSKGTVIAKKAGTATITAKVGKKSYKCKVTVKKPYLNATSKSLTEGKTYTLKVTGTTAKSWTTSKKSVATVSSKGKVTAKKAGTATITCKGKDGKSYKCKITVKAKHTHKYSSKITKAATCANEGVRTYTCSCGNSYTKPIAKLTTHSWNAGKITKKATCTVDGVKTYTCTVCGKTKTEVITKTGHKYVNTVVNPSCTEKGYTEHKCSNCGDVYKDTYTNVLGHDYQEHVMQEVTCTQEGEITYICNRCNDSYTKTIPATGHNYVDKVVKATCEDVGYTEHICNVCGHSYRDNYIDVIKHNLNFKETIEPTKKEAGYTVYICSECHKEIKDNFVDYNPTEEQVYADIIAMQKEYPEGMQWTNSNYYRSTDWFYGGGYGCYAFGGILSDAAFGYLEFQDQHTDFDNIKVGDVLRINNDTHSVVVLKVNSNSVVVAEGNYNSSIHWGREISIETIKATGTYVWTRYPQ